MSRRKPRTFEEMKALGPEVGRAHWRRRLADLQKRWRPLYVVKTDNTVRLVHDAENYDEFNLAALRQAMPVEHYLIVRDLLRHVEEQAQAAVIADRVAREAIEAQAKRRAGGSTTATERKEAAEDRSRKLVKEARKILKDSPSTSISNVAGTLADRGLGGKAAIEKILGKNLKGDTEGR